MHRDPFKDYIKQSEPSIREKGYAWHTAIGLQSVDGLKPSKYLIHTAIKNTFSHSKRANIYYTLFSVIIKSKYSCKQLILIYLFCI